MSSIRLRLFATLALVTALVWGGAVVWVEIQTRAEVQRVLDRRLMESARMVSSLMQAGSVRPAMQAPESGAADVYDRQLCGHDRDNGRAQCPRRRPGRRQPHASPSGRRPCQAIAEPDPMPNPEG